ncbi:potassium voltage-gated channel subfamily E member 3 [Dryobates pubescens]|uniref:potassium voltage-gated channel subfamily E member 3 n=1 Tax=Dryobates pubescens TaxID=118200 RepID=UPI0023B9C5D0|nr:potassium voltage-gated channel subfamily E member 3 [Dryobates pubescens]
MPNRTEPWQRSLGALLGALNHSLQGAAPCPPGAGGAGQGGASRDAGRDANAFLYILFVMTLFAGTVGSLVLGYTRARREEGHRDPPPACRAAFV